MNSCLGVHLARFRIRVSTHHNEKSSNTNHSKFHQLTNTIKKQVCDYFYWCKWSGFQLHTLLNLFSISYLDKEILTFTPN